MRCTTVQLWDIYRRILLRSLVLCKHRRAEGERGGGEGSTFFCFFSLLARRLALFQYVRQPVKWYLRFFTFARVLASCTCTFHLRYVITKRMKRNLLKYFFFFFFFLIKTKRISETYLFSYLKDTLRRNIKLNLSLKFHETRWHTFPNIFLKISAKFLPRREGKKSLFCSRREENSFKFKYFSIREFFFSRFSSYRNFSIIDIREWSIFLTVFRF